MVVIPARTFRAPSILRVCSPESSATFFIAPAVVSLIDEVLNLITDEHQLVNAGSAAITGLEALVATRPEIEFRLRLRRHVSQAKLSQLVRRGFIFLFAVGADLSDQPLRHYGNQRGADQIWLHPEVEQSADCAG